MLKDSASAPATVPVSSNGNDGDGDHAKVLADGDAQRSCKYVLGID